MSEVNGGLMTVAITRDEARVWTSGDEPGVKPEGIHAPSEMSRHHHVREAQHHHGHDTDHANPAYYESITRAVDGASQIVLVGHGRGKADEMLRLTQYWERKHPDVAQKVVGAIDSDLEALTDNQVLALVRDWFEQYPEFV
ncbi:MAG TPA: hypothetical protein VII84_02220 [Acidimicrobiales bacterium]